MSGHSSLRSQRAHEPQCVYVSSGHGREKAIFPFILGTNCSDYNGQNPLLFGPYRMDIIFILYERRIHRFAFKVKEMKLSLCKALTRTIKEGCISAGL